KKIWLDAYEQVSFGSGNKYPKVNEEITKMVSNKGTLIFNYVGHGGENSMAHERVVTRDEIVNWDNYDKLSFYITASCEIAKIDNLIIETPGELMLMDENGGAIGMVATTRAVYIGLNTRLNSSLVNDNLLKKVNGQKPAIGEAYRIMRNLSASEGTNQRCFILLGDPAMRLLDYQYDVVTTAINGTEIGLFSDTLKALSLVTIEGEIRGKDGQVVTDFMGEAYPTFYDKKSKYKTLGQDPSSKVIEFEEQNRIIYKGKVSVTNGKFSFKFVVPKDIAYNVAKGKLSYYAKDGTRDAGGTEYNYPIGGTSDSLMVDNQFDELELFIDDESWVFGGTTSGKPLLLAHLKDSNGINTIGSGIGREMEAIIDAGTEGQQSVILNDYFKAQLNSYTEGTIEYPLENMSAGRHTLKLIVWDVYNNSAEAYTEFVIGENEDISLNNVLNYPNPFNNYTEFHFDHNKSGQNITVKLNILSVAGNVVKSITQEITNAPAHSSEITWDGRDDFGDRLARGVYLYNLEVRAEDGTTSSKTEKLYIVN
ncbi:MAG TPA: oxidoreductase, partial [Bacteroidetes bacterium]|nr:oxidoreductase [Bacteroidota bacterium]